MTQFYYAAAPQQAYAPQGIFGDILGAVGAPLGSVLGGLAGNQQLGQQLGGMAGQLGRMIPLEAGPQFGYVPQQAYAPQGIFGDILGAVGAPLGSVIGGLAGNQQLGQQLGGMAGQLGRMIPLEAGPQFGYAPQQVYAPQGILGGILGGPLGGALGGLIGGLAGNRQLGEQIGSAAGSIGGGLLPLSVGVVPAQQAYAPQGIFGDILGAVGPPLTGIISSLAGNQQLGQQISGMGGLPRLVPLQAGPNGFV